MYRRFTLLGLLGLTLLATSCIVTDEIEFYDKINNPPSLHRLEPATDSVLIVNTGTQRSFTVTVWDPDEKDANVYQGYITIIEQLNSGATRETPERCNRTEVTTPNSDEYDGGIMVTFECNVFFQINNAPAGSTAIVEVDVSDRGFLASRDMVREGGRSLRMTWAVELYPPAAN